MTPERFSVLHSWCIQADWDAPTIVGGKGAWFWDENGRRYLDMSRLSECMTLGHQHPGLIRAIRKQAEKLCFVSAAWGAEPRARLAELLLKKSGFEGGRVFFTLGGADANAAEVGTYFMDRLRELQTRFDVIGEVRGKGLMIGIELVTDRVSRTPAKKLCDAVLHRAFHNGLILLSCGASTVRFIPPLMATKSDVDEAMTILEASLDEAIEGV